MSGTFESRVLNVAAGSSGFGAPSSQTTSFSAAYNTVYIIDTTSGAMTITLPAPTSGSSFIVKDKGGQLSTNAATFARPGSQKIDNVTANKVYSVDYGSVTVYSDGTDYFTI
jgi:hypothetical protein